MVQTGVPVRATARVGTSPGGAASASAPVLHKRSGYLGPIHAVQLMIVEAIIVGGLVIAGHGTTAAIAAVVGGVLLLAAVLVRRDGRWWLERVAMGRQFRRRNAAKPIGGLSDRRLAALQFLAPGLTVDDVAAPDGSRVGVASDEAGWYGIATLTGVSGVVDTATAGLPLDRLVTALADPDRTGRAVVQLVTHSVPVPEPIGPAGSSYQSLLHRLGPVPVDRVTWLAVRLDARALAEMGARAPEEAPAKVAALLRHLTKAVRRDGVTARPLDRDGVLDALTRSCDLALPGGVPLADPHEEWDAWYSGRLAHRAYWLRDWPPGPTANALLGGLAAVPAALTSIAIVLAPSGDRVDVRCLARIATAPNRLATVVHVVQEHARATGARLLAMDGEHGPAAYATAPTGGGPR